MSDDFRYLDQARALGESLRDIEVASTPPPELETGGLDRIARGETAFAKMADGVPTPAPAPLSDAKKHELKVKLKSLLTKKQEQELNKQLKVACFVEHSKLAVLQGIEQQGPGHVRVHLDQDMIGNALERVLLERINKERHGEGLAPLKSLRETPPEKRANFTDPSSSTTLDAPVPVPGAGEEPKPKRPVEGIHQGPAANFFAKELKELREEEKAQKQAASRLDKEVAKGNVSYADTSRFIPKDMPFERQKEVSREIAHRPSRVPMKSLLLRRDIQEARHRNKQLLSEKARTEGTVAPKGPKGMPALDNTGRIFDRPERPIGYHMGRDEINAPSTAGQTARATIRKGRAPRPGEQLPKKRGVDKTMNMHALSHEEGEREAFARGLRGQDPMHIHSGHVDTRPVVVEKSEVVGDPKAQRLAKSYRNLDPDDRMVARLAKQVGDHPDAPIQVGSKKERALQRLLEKNKDKLDPRVGRRAAENLNYWKEIGLPVKVPTAVQAIKKLAAEIEDEVRKQAASRLDKEVKAGRMTYAQAYGLPASVPVDDAKKWSRDIESSASDVASNVLDRRRRLNDALYKNRMQMGRYGDTHLINAHVPFQGPMNLGLPGIKQTATFAPDTSGQWLRAVTEGQGAAARAATLGDASKLPAREGVDSTLNRAILEHEVGEGFARQGDVIHPHSSHGGVQPLLRENLALQGDPDAQRYFRRIRRAGDDSVVAKAIKQVGGHPDRPLALDGKQQAAVQRILERQAGKLTPATHGRAAATQMMASALGSNQRVATAPAPLLQQAAAVGGGIRTLHKPLMQGSPWQRLTGFVSNYRAHNAAGKAFGDTVKTLLAKQAARMDKEIAAGNIRLQDVDPSIPVGMDPRQATQMARANAYAAAPMTPEQLAQYDRMDAAWKRNQHLRATAAQQRLANPDANYRYGMFDPGSSTAAHSLRRQDQLAAAVQNAHRSRMGPAAVLQPGQEVPTVYMPDSAARWARTFNEGHPLRASAGTMHPAIGERLFEQAKPWDNTMNRALGAHEITEQAALMRAMRAPLSAYQKAEENRAAAAVQGVTLPVQEGELLQQASHAGVGPVALERIHARGHPQVNAELDQLRTHNPDDVLIQKKIKQRGFTPNNPMPAYGRDQNRLEAWIRKNPQAMDKNVQRANLMAQAANTMQGHPVHMVNVPAGGHAALQSVGEHGQEFGKAFRNLVQQPSMDTLAHAGKRFGTLRSTLGAFKKVIA